MAAFTESEWRHARTFYPLFLEYVTSEPVARVLVVGASDGKFVLPLARRGIAVTAVDIDGDALVASDASLKQRVAEENLEDLVECVQGDIRDLSLGQFDAVWTSCSWHYSRNFDRSLAEFINCTAACVSPAGIFGAEYMMPIAVRHVEVDHYLEPGEIWGYLRGWERLWDVYTSVYIEDPHPGQADRHVHRMGLAIARRGAY